VASVTIREVAELAEVSIKTVSRVLNNERYVKEETRKKVENAIHKLGFVASIPARRLASGQSYTIGLIFHNASWHYIQDVQKGVMETAHQYGYSTLLHPCDITSENNAHGIMNLVYQKQVDGFIFTPPADNAKGLILELKNIQFPFVRLTPMDRESQLPYVSATDKQGAFDMTMYLIQLGHTRVGYIIGPQEQRAAHDRFAGYTDALQEAGIRFDQSIVMQGDDHFESGYSAASKIVSLQDRPTAIFCNNDEMAAGAMSAIFEAGLKVPEDISVAGFDNIPLSRQIWPPLTTVEQPISEIAEKATKHLIALLRGEEVECLHCNIPTRLVIRKSTR